MVAPVRTLAVVALAVAAMLSFVMRPAYAGTPALWFVLVGGYICLAAWAVFALRAQGELGALLRPRSGDLTAGILSGFVSMGAGMFVLQHLAPVNGARGAWLFQLYAQVGDVQGESMRTLGLLCVVLLEELVWRGFVQTQVLQAWGARAAVPVTAALYTLAHVPTLFALAAPGVGLNPLLVLAALGFGLVWGFLTLFTHRLLPAVMCHAVVSYFLAAPAPTWLF